MNVLAWILAQPAVLHEPANIFDRQDSITLARASVGPSLRRSRPGAPLRRVSSIKLWTSWPSISAMRLVAPALAQAILDRGRLASSWRNRQGREVRISRHRRVFLLAYCWMKSLAAEANVLSAQLCCSDFWRRLGGVVVSHHIAAHGTLAVDLGSKPLAEASA